LYYIILYIIYSQADVSGQPISPILQVEYGTDRLSRNVGKELPLLAV